MTSDEAADYVEGARRRWRPFFEGARYGWCLQVANSEGKTAQDLFPFSWDEKPKKQRVTKKQRDALRARAEEIAKMLQNGKQ